MKSKVYTKGGDKGETSLVGGQRIPKCDGRIDLYGDVDELNSHIGLLLSYMAERVENFEKGFLHNIQNTLFDLGSNLACEDKDREKFKLPRLTENMVENIEIEIDRMDQSLIPIKNFILPGGCIAASQAHVCRTVCRRVERKLINFAITNPNEIPLNSKQFLNRLSDFLFVFARYANMLCKEKEILWGSNE